MRVFFLLSSQYRSSSVSVVFVFNTSLNDIAPLSPIQLPVVVMIKEKSELLVDVFGVYSFFLSSPVRSSFVSVVFDFNDSLNDNAPVITISFPVNVKRKDKSELLMDVFCVSSFVFTFQIDFSECCV